MTVYSIYRFSEVVVCNDLFGDPLCSWKVYQYTRVTFSASSGVIIVQKPLFWEATSAHWKNGLLKVVVSPERREWRFTVVNRIHIDTIAAWNEGMVSQKELLLHLLTSLLQNIRPIYRVVKTAPLIAAAHGMPTFWQRLYQNTYFTMLKMLVVIHWNAQQLLNCWQWL